jgi:hypothetical protein
MALVVVTTGGTGGASLAASIGSEFSVIAKLERLLDRLAGAAAEEAGSVDGGKSAIVRRRSAREISSGFSR